VVVVVVVVVFEMICLDLSYFITSVKELSSFS
jgi:hypothetical protein